MPENKKFDVIISGGGMVGASLAHALSGHGLQIAIIEAHVYSAASSPSFDDRAIALSYGSKRILDALMLWPSLADEAEPIKKIHVSDQGHFGFTRLDSAEEKVEALGYVVTARALGECLVPSLSRCEDVTLFCPGQLKSFDVSEQCVTVVLQSGQKLTAQLLVAADGDKSLIRQQLGISVKEEAYEQSAIVSNVIAQQSNPNVAYERFTQSGPVALLPMTQNRHALVYTVDAEFAQQTMALSDEDFLAQLQQRFGYRLGRFTQIGERRIYALGLKEVQEHVRPRVALIGNAAHTVHPIAGQGFNLGIRDVAVLAEVILQAQHASSDFGQLSVLSAYTQWRKKDQRSVLWATDSLVRLFSNPLSWVKSFRNLGMIAVDMLPGARRLMSRQAMGLGGKQPKLSRGVPLE